jgi:hypothetical protein
MSSKPAMQRSSVVLPQPEGPSRQAMLPVSTRKADAIDDGMRSVALDDSFEFEVCHQKHRVIRSAGGWVRARKEGHGRCRRLTARGWQQGMTGLVNYNSHLPSAPQSHDPAPRLNPLLFVSAATVAALVGLPVASV